MQKLIHFIGIDVSKKTLDVAIIKDNDPKTIRLLSADNNLKGFKELKSLLKKDGLLFANTIFCLEHTGYYSRAISKFIVAQKGNLWLEMSLKIIRSLGIQRGKNDRIDAKRIAIYAYKNKDDFKPYDLHNARIESIRTLLMLRSKLINSKTSLTVPINELASVDKEAGKFAMKAIAKTIDVLDKNIEAINEQIQQLINQDEELKELQTLVTSVPGVGNIVFYNLLYFTNQFTRYTDGKQLACYCGVVPFEHTSGSSVRGKPRVHSMANKQMKKLLHTSALAAVTYYPEFKAYYERKVAEGKNKMLVLNNVRNKIVLRIVAVIKSKQPYIAAA